MSDLEAIEVLTQAKERLFECGWGRGTVDYGRKDFYGDDPNSFCLEEAVCGRHGQFINPRSVLHPVLGRVGAYLERAIRDECELWWWNDEQQSAGPVFDAIDRAIEIAKESPYPS